MTTSNRPPNAGSAAPSALGVPNVRIFVAGQALSNIGTFFQIVALSLLVLQMTGSGFALGATMSVGALPFLLLGPWAGTVIDRVPIRWLLVSTSTLACLQAATIGAIVLSGSTNIAWILVLTFVLGFVQIFDRPGSQAFLNELASDAQLPSAVAMASSAQSVGRLGGPAIAALVYASLGPAWCFFINAASYLAVVIALLLLNGSQMIPRRRARRMTGQLREGLRFVARSPLHRTTLIANGVIGCLAFNFPLFYSSLVTKGFHGPPVGFGIAESLNAITAVGGALYLARSPIAPTRRLYALACIGLGTSLAWSAASPTLGLFYAGMLYFGATVVLYGTSAQSLIQQNTPPEMLGRVMSLYVLGSMGTTPLGGLIAGWVIDAAGPRAAIGLGAASAIGAGMFMLLRHSDGGRLETPDERDSATAAAGH